MSLTTNATSLFTEIHGENTQLLSREAIIQFAESYHARKIQEAMIISAPNDTYVEELRKPPSVNLGIADIP